MSNAFFLCVLVLQALLQSAWSTSSTLRDLALPASTLAPDSLFGDSDQGTTVLSKVQTAVQAVTSAVTSATLLQTSASAVCKGEWNGWSCCTQDCGGGIQTRTYHLFGASVEHCPAEGTVEQQNCNIQPCEDCQGSWSDWTPCQPDCDVGNDRTASGFQQRVYTILKPEQSTSLDPTSGSTPNKGRPCPIADGFIEPRVCDRKCPIPCKGDWVSSPCSQTCAGIQTVTYVITEYEKNGGAECSIPDGQTIYLACNGDCPPQPPAVDCVGEYLEWLPCSSPNACNGGGQRSRTYIVRSPAENGGQQCEADNGATSQEQCNLDIPCPQDCKGTWDDWTECSATCGGGVQTHPFKVLIPSAHGGAACPEPEHQTCNTAACPLPEPCVGEWTDWGACTKSCGGGSQSKAYKVLTKASNGGAPCPSRDDEIATQSCNTQLKCECPLVLPNGVFWSEWSGCSVTCGGGTETRQFHGNGGPDCPSDGSEQSRTCNTAECPPPSPCRGEWSEWSGCSATCGGGEQTHTYRVLRAAENNGEACAFADGAVSSQACNPVQCPVPVNCRGSWSGWSVCSSPCGIGTQLRTYTISVPAANNGAECSNADGNSETVDCDNSHVCPQHCEGRWADEWTACSTSCGGGISTLAYFVDKPALNNGAPCPESKTQSCNNFDCSPVSCVGRWSGYSCCTQPCGGGEQSNTFSHIVKAERGGTHCPYQDGYVMTVPCNLEPCAACDAGWGFWSDCTVTCGGGNRQRTYTLSAQTAALPNRCPADGTVETDTCAMQSCPRGCIGAFTEWDVCSRSCGPDGTQTRTFRVTQSAEPGGIQCESNDGLTQTQACNTEKNCPVDCIGSFGSWSACSRTCGADGASTRSYVVTQASAFSGAQCPYSHGFTESQQCNTQTCPVACIGGYGSWSQCSRTCGPSGTQTRTYTISQPSVANGPQCPYENGHSDTQPCNTALVCPVDCVGSFGAWSPCSVTCGTGTQFQTYSISTQPVNGGAACPFAGGYVQTQVCNAGVSCAPVCNALTVWQATTQSGSLGAANCCRCNNVVRSIIKGSNLSQSGSKIRLTFGDGNIYFTSAYIGEQGSGATFASTPIKVSFNGGDTTSVVHSTVSSPLVSDWLNFAVSTSKNYLVSFFVPCGPNDNFYEYVMPSGQIGSYNQPGLLATNAGDMSLSNPAAYGAVLNVKLVEVQNC